MFRRRPDTETESAPSSEPAVATSGTARTPPKGRPTPSRREAEAAARAKAKVPRSRREMTAAQRKARAESTKRARAGMRNGDERHLMPRDKGPVRRFLRDYVDSRFSFLEIVLPLVLLTTVLTYSGVPRLAEIGSTVMLMVLVVILIDVLNLRVRLRKELARRFPDQPTRGATWYAVSRSMQMRFMRLPKTQARIGQKLSDTYR